MGERTYTLCMVEVEPGNWQRGAVVARQRLRGRWWGHVECTRAPGCTRVVFAPAERIKVMDPQPTVPGWQWEGYAVDEQGAPLEWRQRAPPWRGWLHRLR